MKNERSTGWLALSANVAVLIGIILVVIELDQNRDSIQAQTRNEIATTAIDFLSLIASDGELASIRRRADSGEQLTPDEAVRYQVLSTANILHMENVHYQYRKGLIHEVAYHRQKEAWRTYIANSQRFLTLWCEGRHLYSRKFVTEVDTLLGENSC